MLTLFKGNQIRAQSKQNIRRFLENIKPFWYDEEIFTSSCNFLSTAILPAVSCTPSMPGLVEGCTSTITVPSGMGAASLTGATTVGGGMLVSLGGEGSFSFLVEGRVNES